MTGTDYACRFRAAIPLSATAREARERAERDTAIVGGPVPLRLTCSVCGVTSLDVFRGETDRIVCDSCCTSEDLGAPSGYPDKNGSAGGQAADGESGGRQLLRPGGDQRPEVHERTPRGAPPAILLRPAIGLARRRYAQAFTKVGSIDRAGYAANDVLAMRGDT